MNKIASILKNENVRKGIVTICNAAKKVSEVAIPIAGAVLIMKLSKNDNVRNVYEYVNAGYVGYDDAIDAIANSYMSSSDKSKSMSAIKMGRSSEYYSAVISIVDSYMCSSDKVKAIENMNEQ